MFDFWFLFFLLIEVIVLLYSLFTETTRYKYFVLFCCLCITFFNLIQLKFPLILFNLCFFIIHFCFLFIFFKDIKKIEEVNNTKDS